MIKTAKKEKTQVSKTIARRNEERRLRIAEAQVVNVIPSVRVFTIIKIIAMIIVIFIQDIEVRLQGRGSTTRLQKDALLEEALVLDSV